MSREVQKGRPPGSGRHPSSASAGTFMREPQLENQYQADLSLRRVIGLFLPPEVIKATSADLSRFGDKVISKKVLDWVSDAERNVPFVKGSGSNSFGQRIDGLVTTEGWRELQKLGFKEGIVALAYENEYAGFSRMVQFVKYHIWTGSSAFVTCPSAMQDGAASLLKRHFSLKSSSDRPGQAVFKAAFERLTARDENAWTSGQWMTERIGGSDVSGTETIATLTQSQSISDSASTQVNGSPLGPWELDGFKWFSSATDSQMSIALAQTSKGLSAFYIPTRLLTPEGHTELNGISISRLKNKMGTKAVPTAELELNKTRAFLLGEEGNGVREISTVLNITRVHNSVTSMGLLGRGLAIAKTFANERALTGNGSQRILKDVPLHVRTLADLTLSYRANMLFTYFTVFLLGMSDQPRLTTSQINSASDRLLPSSSDDLQLILRVLTPALKALTAKASISGLQECMESLGGIGYLENEESQHINVSRLYRDANVLSIWEGTTNVLGTDFVKIWKGRNGICTLNSLTRWVHHALATNGPRDGGFTVEKEAVTEKLAAFGTRIRTRDFNELVIDSRELMENFAVIVTGTLMLVDAERDKDAISVELCRRFARDYMGQAYESSWEDRAAWDSRIVFGGVQEIWHGKSRL